MTTKTILDQLQIVHSNEIIPTYGCIISQAATHNYFKNQSDDYLSVESEKNKTTKNRHFFK